jgi:hypothetical protein
MACDDFIANFGALCKSSREQEMVRHWQIKRDARHRGILEVIG